MNVRLRKAAYLSKREEMHGSGGISQTWARPQSHVLKSTVCSVWGPGL